jgi:hypothetical protein
MITSLPLDRWPEEDRLAWLQACAPGRRQSCRGALSHLKSISQDDLKRRYGYFLEALRERGVLEPNAGAGQLVTPENVDHYLDRVRPDFSSATLAGSIWKLLRVAAILSPASAFSWLSEIATDLDLVAHRKERFDRIISSEVLVRAGLTLVKEAQLADSRRPIWRVGQIRDGLMIALLAYHPIRLRPFSEIELGRSFVREGDRWVIKLSGQQVKTGRPDLRLVRARLNPAIALYLTWARPRLQRRYDEMMIGDEISPYFVGPLWVGQYGDALGYGSVEKRIVETARATIGTVAAPRPEDRG